MNNIGRLSIDLLKTIILLIIIHGAYLYILNTMHNVSVPSLQFYPHSKQFIILYNVTNVY